MLTKSFTFLSRNLYKRNYVIYFAFNVTRYILRIYYVKSKKLVLFVYMLYIFAQVLFRAKKQDNHQNFDPPFLPKKL